MSDDNPNASKNGTQRSRPANGLTPATRCLADAGMASGRIAGWSCAMNDLSLGEGGGDDTDPRGCGPWLVTVALAAVVFAAIRGAA
jgi:hypothetical protein